MKENNYFHIWLMPMNRIQYRTRYSGCPVGNSPKVMHFYIIASIEKSCTVLVFVVS